MNKVTLVENPLDSGTWVDHDVEDVRGFLVDHFKIWPKNAHIYLDHISKKTDITPYDNFGIQRLGSITGHLYVVVYPEGVELILLVVAISVAAVAIGLAFLFRPSVNVKSQQQQGPNNQLSDRQNQARPNQRIPDIFGKLQTTFDLIAVPYRTFVTNIEIEHCYMCIGRGEYDIDIATICDDITALQKIDGASARVFGPNGSPNNAAIPIYTIGPAFAESVYNLKQFGFVNGQLIQAPNLSGWLGGVAPFGSNNLRFISPNIIENRAGWDFTQSHQAGDSIYLGGLVANDGLAVDSGGVQPTVDLSGIYPVTSVSATQIVLTSPATINANWSALAAFAGGVSAYGNDNFLTNNPFWIGKFFIPRPDVTKILCNFVAQQGSYKTRSQNAISGQPIGTQLTVDTGITVGITPCDATGTATGAEVLFSGTLIGSHTDKVQKGLTITCNVTPGVGGVLIRAHRTSQTDPSGNYNSSDAVQWRDCYVISTLAPNDFGNVTTIQTLIRATQAATAVKERKLNAIVTRKVPAYLGGTSFGAVAASKNAADIIAAMALDPFIGRMDVSQLNLTNIYSIAGTGGDIERYFAVFGFLSAVTEFCYTFDDSKVSFEESMLDIANAIFCQAFRRGSKLELSFEQQTDQSVLLFNHRNKIPGSETRTMSFGMLNDNDGITLTYVEPNAPNYPNLDTQVTLYFPPNQSAVNPKKIDTIGIRNVQQATLLGWRLYKKLLYQNLVVQFEATEETQLLVLQDRILVADNTRSDTQDGEVQDVVALELTLSQNVTFDARFNYTIFLQLPDGTVESIPITAGSNAYKVILGHAPSIALVTDNDKSAKTTYMIVHDGPVQQTACLLSEKTPKDSKTFEVKVVNYDDEYYNHDNDYKSNVDVAQLTLEVVTS